ncbi:MAG: hypothetical protein AUJ07_08665 [Crenarchaeota archaeon 13_1_40CM_3_53_5]|nr:MAG: hypothetical protein AUJ07_08665 [Crenarchaeota archaeon 13_1_40CM_3_53_5]
MPKQYENDNWIYDQLVPFIKTQVDLEDDRHFELLASGVLHSYRVREYRTTPYFFFHGPKGTGKNRCLHILQALCYRGLLSSDTSGAGLYQTGNLFHPTLLVDEGEKLAP